MESGTPTTKTFTNARASVKRRRILTGRVLEHFLSVRTPLSVRRQPEVPGVPIPGYSCVGYLFTEAMVCTQFPSCPRRSTRVRAQSDPLSPYSLSEAVLSLRSVGTPGVCEDDADGARLLRASCLVDEAAQPSLDHRDAATQFLGAARGRTVSRPGPTTHTISLTASMSRFPRASHGATHEATN